jgi:DNA-binding response OmpR family regulator
MALIGKRVLIVEDENIIAMDLAYQVSSSGAKVVGTVGSVDTALHIIATTDLDGVILDLDLGGEAAFPVADALAARHIPFVFATAMSSRDTPARYANVACLEKPFA